MREHLELYIKIINPRFFNYYKKDNSVTIHQRNLQVLATEIFKAKNDLPEIMKQFFELRGNVNTTHYGFQSIKYLAPKIWDLVPDQIKHCGSLTKFKHFIKSWSPSDCPCGLCKTYITQVGFGET